MATLRQPRFSTAARATPSASALRHVLPVQRKRMLKLVTSSDIDRESFLLHHALKLADGHGAGAKHAWHVARTIYNGGWQRHRERAAVEHEDVVGAERAQGCLDVARR